MYLDIVFKIGDSYYEASSSGFWDTIIGAFVGALLSGLFAIWVFERGIKNEKEKEAQKESNRIKRSLATFHTLLKSIIKTTKQQTSDFDEYIEKIKKNPLSNLVPKQLPHASLDRIQKLSTSELIELFQHLFLTTDDYLKTVNNLDYLYAVLNQIPKDIESVKGNSIHDLSTKFIQTRGEIITTCTDFLIEMKRVDPKHKDNELWKFIDGLIVDYYKGVGDGNPDLQYDYDKLVTPLKTVLIFKFPLEPVSNEILKKTKIASDIIYTIKEFNSGFATDLSTATEQIKVSITEIEALLKKIKIE